MAQFTHFPVHTILPYHSEPLSALNPFTGVGLLSQGTPNVSQDPELLEGLESFWDRIRENPGYFPLDGRKRAVTQTIWGDGIVTYEYDGTTSDRRSGEYEAPDLRGWLDSLRVTPGPRRRRSDPEPDWPTIPVVVQQRLGIRRREEVMVSGPGEETRQPYETGGETYWAKEAVYHKDTDGTPTCSALCPGYQIYKPLSSVTPSDPDLCISCTRAMQSNHRLLDLKLRAQQLCEEFGGTASRVGGRGPSL